MKHKLLRLSLWLFLGALALLLIFFGILYLNRDKIKAMAIEETNSLLEVPVAVDAIEVSLKKFPHASLRFSKVYCRGRSEHPADTLFFAKALYFEFNLWEVFSDDLSIKKISAEDGSIAVVIPADGPPNYEIWKTDSSHQSGGFFTLEEVSLKNFRSRFYHQSSDTRIFGFVDDYWMSGSFGNSMSLTHKADLTLDSLNVDGENYFRQSELSTEFLLEGQSDLFVLKNATASINNIPLNFKVLSQQSGVEIEAEAPEMDLEKFSALAQNQNWSWPEHTTVKGRGKLSYYSKHPFVGPFSITADLHFEDAQVSGITDARISSLSGSASYRYENGKDVLHISEISGKGESGSFSGALLMKDLQKPYVVLDLKSDLGLAEWMLLAPIDTIAAPRGRVALDLHLENQFKSLNNIAPRELARAKTKGKLELKEVGFAFVNSEHKVDLVNGELRFDGSNLRIENFYVKTGQSDVYLKGHFRNVLNYVFFDNEKLAINAKVVSRNINLQDFVSGESSAADAKPASADTSYNLNFASSLQLDLDLEVQGLVFHSFRARNIRGNLLINNGEISGRSLSFDADQGHYTGGFDLDTRHNPYRLSARLNTSNISLHDVFLSFNNFDQEAILAENIYGRADIDMKMSANLSPGLDVDISSIDLQAQVSITDGAIKNYEPMSALSDYAELDELQHVKFSKLENSIRIKNSIITIPRMNISSNVMDLELEGTHSFENIIDYDISLKLSEVLFSKRRKKSRKSEFDEHLVVVENEDDPTIHVQMRGPATDPDISIKKLKVGKEYNRGSIFSKKAEPRKNSSGIRYDLFNEQPDSTAR